MGPQVRAVGFDARKRYRLTLEPRPSESPGLGRPSADDPEVDETPELADDAEPAEGAKFSEAPESEDGVVLEEDIEFAESPRLEMETPELTLDTLRSEINSGG